MAGLKFEQALERLEETVRALESPDLPIEESLRLFEEGVRVSKLCMKMLDEADRKIARLTDARPEDLPPARGRRKPLGTSPPASEEGEAADDSGPSEEAEG